MRVAWNIAETAQVVASLYSRSERLPVRTVVVPNGRVAHAIRRELVWTGEARALNGTRFVLAESLAADTLEDAGVDFVEGEDAQRPFRVSALLEEESSRISLESLDIRLLRQAPGWNDAIARTISDLEAAGFRSDTFRVAAETARERDLASLWEALDSAAGTSWTRSRILFEAATRRAALTRPSGAFLAVILGDESRALATFVRSLPGASLVCLGARPNAQAFLRRLEATWGRDVLDAVTTATQPGRTRTSRRESLVSWIFEDPDLRASVLEHAPPIEDDDSLALEEHAGADDEIEAAVEWVLREACERGTPAGDIALLVPEPDPLLTFLHARLSRAPWPKAEAPLHVAGGLPLSFLADGAQALLLLQALAEGLPGDRLADLLPALSTEPPPESAPREWPYRLSRNQAIAVLVSIGAFGPRVAEPESGGFDASRTASIRLSERISLLETSVGRPLVTERDRQGVEEERRLLGLLRGIGPAMSELFSLAELVRDGATIDSLAGASRRFLRDRVQSRPRSTSAKTETPSVAERLAPAFDLLVAARSELRGVSAMRALAAAARLVRVPVGRFGTPSIYLGTVRDAVGLAFRSVRIVGASEGALPRSGREDPLLPDDVRERLSSALPRSDERSVADARALHRVLLENLSRTGGRVVLSTARADAEGTTHEPSTFFLEAVSSLVKDLPADLPTLRHRFLSDSRHRSQSARIDAPIDEMGRLERAAHLRSVPRGWLQTRTLDLVRIATLLAGGAEADGLLHEDDLREVRGLSASHPISASDLHSLLGCSFRFLQERVLRRHAPRELPSAREIDVPRFGSLYHGAIESFSRDHAAGFERREHRLPRAETLPPFWEDRGRLAARNEIEEFVRWYPLDEAARDALHMRLENAVVGFLRSEWERPPMQFVSAEEPFGYDPPLSIAAGDGALFVRGVIDRIDRDGIALLIRDFKTGAPHPREGEKAGPTPSVDLQLALYLLASSDRAPRVEGAFSYATPWGVMERAFRSDAHVLAGEGRRWLQVAADLLRTRSFPRTPDPDDCAHCPFVPTCGAGAQERTWGRVPARPELQAFAALKGER